VLTVARAAVPEAGLVAAELMESMRRGALARTLRDGGERFLGQLPVVSADGSGREARQIGAYVIGNGT